MSVLLSNILYYYLFPQNVTIKDSCVIEQSTIDSE